MFNQLYILLLCLLLPCPAALAQVFDVGPSHPHKHLRSIDWNGLKPGDEVRIHARPEPYRKKLIIRSSGTRKQPIIIRGISDKAGNKPVIDGAKALAFQKTDIQLSRRALIIVGDSQIRANHIILDNLEMRNANNTQQFIYSKTLETYAANGTAVYIQNGHNVTIQNCHIHSCCIGIQTAYYPDVDNVVLRGNYIHNNGDFTRQRWGHNVYMSGRRTLIEFNHFGELVSDGNNIKDRSQAVIIRYNWIQGGMSRQIDLVETNRYPMAHAWVYGNTIINGQKTKNPKMILFGGDLPEKTTSRSGLLYFFNNTVHFNKNAIDAFIIINRADCSGFLSNNAFVGGGLTPRIISGPGRVTGSNNLTTQNAFAENLLNTFHGGFEQFRTIHGISYFPHKFSLLVSNGTSQVPAKVKYMPSPDPGKKIRRPVTGTIDIGAFEYVQ